MNSPWQPLKIGEHGLVLNAKAHDSVVEAVGLIGPYSVGIAWRTPEGGLHAIRARSGSPARFFASGLIFDAIIGSIYLRAAVELGLPEDFSRFSDDVLRLRKAAKTYIESPEWFLEFELIMGERMLIAGRGAPDVLETKSLLDISELYS